MCDVIMWPPAASVFPNTTYSLNLNLISVTVSCFLLRCDRESLMIESQFGDNVIVHQHGSLTSWHLMESHFPPGFYAAKIKQYKAHSKPPKLPTPMQITHNLVMKHAWPSLIAFPDLFVWVISRLLASCWFDRSSGWMLMCLRCGFRWFQQGPNPHTSSQDWLFSGGYWDRKYSQLPDIY